MIYGKEFWVKVRREFIYFTTEHDHVMTTEEMLTRFLFDGRRINKKTMCRHRWQFIEEYADRVLAPEFKELAKREPVFAKKLTEIFRMKVQ